MNKREFDENAKKALNDFIVSSFGKQVQSMMETVVIDENIQDFLKEYGHKVIFPIATDMIDAHQVFLPMFFTDYVPRYLIDLYEEKRNRPFGIGPVDVEFAKELEIQGYFRYLWLVHPFIPKSNPS